MDHHVISLFPGTQLIDHPYKGSSFGTIILLSKSHNHGNTSWHEAHSSMLTCRVLNLVLYCGLTVAIAYRLWWANSRVSRLYAGGGRYTPALLTVAESGAVFAAASIVVLVLSASNNPTIVAATSPVTQLAVRRSFFSL